MGCGDGLFCSILFSCPVEVGVDISCDELRGAMRKGVYKDIVAGDLSMLPFKSETFNTAICNSVMEHVIDLEKALKEAYRILLPGGKLIITLPTENYKRFLFYPKLLRGLGLKNLAAQYKELVNTAFRHYHAYTSSHWVRVIENSGFKVLQTIQYLSENAMALNDFYLPFSLISLLNKKIFRRWIFCYLLRIPVAGLLELLFKRIYLDNDIKEGACILIEAQRV